MKLKGIIPRMNFFKRKNDAVISLNNFSSNKRKKKTLKIFVGVLRRFKIQTRIGIAFSVLMLIPLVITGTSSFIKSSNAVHNKISSYSSELMVQVGANIEKEIAKYTLVGNQIALSPDNQDFVQKYKTLNGDDESNAVKKFNDAIGLISNTDSNILGISLLSNKGENIGGTAVLSQEDTKTIMAAADNGSGPSTWSLVKDSSGLFTICNTSSIKSNMLGVTIGYLVMTLNENSLSDVLKNVNLGKNSQCLIIDSNGKILSSVNETEIGSEYNNKGLINGINAKEKAIAAVKDSKAAPSRVFNLEGNKGKAMVTYERIENTDWFVVGTIPYTLINQETNSILINLVFVGFICFMMALFVVYLISKSISEPLNELNSLMNEAKEGNLTRLVENKSSDEIGLVITSYNGMVRKISSLISKVKDLSLNVSENTDKITGITEQSHASSEQIATTMQQIASGSSYQAAEAQACVENMNTLSDRINVVGTNMSSVSLVLKNVDKTREEAMESVKYLNNKALETEFASNSIVTNINNLGNNMKEIKNIVEMIVGISEQTNLLALNAAIEAARAGESGRGFAVVADEVRKLAVQSKNASSQINSILGSIQEKTNITTNEANKTMTIVKAQMDAVNKTDDSLKHIFEVVDVVVLKLNSMSSSISEIVASKENTLNSIEGISSVSEENAATTEEVSASTEEQIAGSQQLSSYTIELKAMVEKLNTAISVFKV
jgi:methyl-accepting chemotaxis protein